MPLSAHEAHTHNPSPRNGRFGGHNSLVRGLLHRMAGSVDGTGLAGYLRENLAPKVRLKSRGRSL